MSGMRNYCSNNLFKIQHQSHLQILPLRFVFESDASYLIQAKAAEQAAAAMQTKINLNALPVRSYLDQTVVPILLQGLAALVKERPENPVEYLAAFLLKNNPQKPEPAFVQPSENLASNDELQASNTAESPAENKQAA